MHDDAGVFRPNPVERGRQYECEVVDERIKGSKMEFYVRWKGWGDIGAEWRDVLELRKDKAMKRKYDGFRKTKDAIEALLLLAKS
jgi:hypothetical protein